MCDPVNKQVSIVVWQSGLQYTCLQCRTLLHTQFLGCPFPVLLLATNSSTVSCHLGGGTCSCTVYLEHLLQHKGSLLQRERGVKFIMRKNSNFFLWITCRSVSDPSRSSSQTLCCHLNHSGTNHGERLRRQRAIWLAGRYLWRSRGAWGLIATLRDLKTGYQILKFSCSLNMWRDRRADTFLNIQTRLWVL